MPRPSKDPDKVAAGRIGGLKTARLHPLDPEKAGRRLRLGFMARFDRLVDPDGKLPEAERQRLADLALREHMARLSMKSAQKRRKGAGAAKDAA